MLGTPLLRLFLTNWYIITLVAKAADPKTIDIVHIVAACTGDSDPVGRFPRLVKEASEVCFIDPSGLRYCALNWPRNDLDLAASSELLWSLVNGGKHAL